MDRLRLHPSERYALRIHPSFTAAPWWRSATWSFHQTSGGDPQGLETREHC